MNAKNSLDMGFHLSWKIETKNNKVRFFLGGGVKKILGMINGFKYSWVLYTSDEKYLSTPRSVNFSSPFPLPGQLCQVELSKK